jgi:hypothetical protein
MKFHLAQANVAIAKYSYDDPKFAGFVDNLDRFNALADSSPGFVWRYVAEDETEAGTEVFGDVNMLFNMSVWESKQSLMDYVYQSAHVEILRKRAEWFDSMGGPILTMWWVPVGTLPTVADAKHRLELLKLNGPSQDAFTFRQFFEAPESEESDSD